MGIKKLRSRMGMTLVEVLVAFVIVSFGILGFTTMVGVAAVLNQNADENREKLKQELVTAEGKLGTPESATVFLTLGDGTQVSLPVNVYHSGNRTLVAYEP